MFFCQAFVTFELGTISHTIDFAIGQTFLQLFETKKMGVLYNERYDLHIAIDF
jgi:hypothetical protein